MAGKTDNRAAATGSEDQGGEGADARRAFLVRLPAPLMAALRAWAAQDVRSLNGQIEYLLRGAVEARRKKSTGS